MLTESRDDDVEEHRETVLRQQTQGRLLQENCRQTLQKITLQSPIQKEIYFS